MPELAQMHPLQPEKTNEYALQNLLFLVILSGLISDLLFKSMFCWKKDWDSALRVNEFKSMFCWKKVIW